MSAHIAAPREVFRFIAHFLFILAGWTLVIKLAFPLAFALAAGEPPLTHVYWDFWWAIHIWLGWCLLSWPRYTYALALGVSVAEIVIVATKLALFLAAPEWTIWNTNWFINKLFVAACFVLLLGTLVRDRRVSRAVTNRM